jgi:hypothetical protein
VHPVVVGYFVDGPNLVTLAMNGWDSTEPAWWLNLQAHPEVSVDLVDGPRQVTGRAAHGDERARLWARWRQIDKNLDAYAARRRVETPVVVFEPRSNRRADGSGSGLTRRAEDGPGPEDPVEGVRPAGPAASVEAGAVSGWHRQTDVRAVVYERYGSPSALRVDDIAIPTPAPGQVLVRIAATSVNLSDWETLRGSPMYARPGGLRTPARRTLGSDIAGWVEAVGQGVTRFPTGHQVYGDNLPLKGGFAEYAVAAESALAHKPAELTLEQASTIPQAGAIALQGTAGAAAGDRVLINGAGARSGSLSVQLAKRLGARVTGVDNAAKLRFMRALARMT